MDRSLEKLIKKVQKEDVVFFLGAGFSINAGAPRVSDIIDAIKEEAGTGFMKRVPKKHMTLRNVSEQFVKECNGRNELISILQNLFSFTPKDLTDHELLYKIPHIKQFFMTNYDTLVEEIFPKPERIVVNSNSSSVYEDDKKATIFKIHGDISTLSDPDSIVITESDYQNYFKCNKFEMMCQALKDAFRKKHVVFIGYSLEDDNVLELIKIVRDCVGSNMKGMFLVAPGFTKRKKGLLKSNGVEYINSYATPVLEAIISHLKQTIASDYKHRKISEETFSKFCLRNGGLITTTTHKEDENVINQVIPTTNAKRHEVLSMDIAKKVTNDIQSGKFNDVFNIQGTSIDIPCYSVPFSDIKRFSHTINGINFMEKDELEALYIAPSYKKRTVTLRMKSISFKEKVEAYSYANNGVYTTICETPICKLGIHQRIVNETTSNFELTFESKEPYQNNNDAIRWADYMLKIMEGNEFVIDDHVVPNGKRNEEGLLIVRRVKEYYEDIRKIESETDISFDVYENYTETNAITAKCIYSYLTGNWASSSVLPRVEVTFGNDKTKTEMPLIKKDDVRYRLVSRQDLTSPIKFNNQSFDIPYFLKVMPCCKIKDIKKRTKNINDVTLYEVDNTCYFLGTKEKLDMNAQNFDYVAIGA